MSDISDIAWEGSSSLIRRIMETIKNEADEDEIFKQLQLLGICWYAHGVQSQIKYCEKLEAIIKDNVTEENEEVN